MSPIGGDLLRLLFTDVANDLHVRGRPHLRQLHPGEVTYHTYIGLKLAFIIF